MHPFKKQSILAMMIKPENFIEFMPTQMDDISTAFINDVIKGNLKKNLSRKTACHT